MSRVFEVARREFVSTALTKGFIIGALVLPALIVPVIFLIGFLMSRAEPPAEQGRIAVIDPTGRVVETFAERIRPEAIAERRAEDAQEVVEQTQKIVGEAAAAQAEQAAAQATQSAIASVPKLAVEEIAAGDDLEAAIEAQQERLRLPAEREDAERLIALVILDPNAVEPSGEVEEGEARFGAYEIFIRPKLDARTTGEIRRSLSWAIVEERFEAAQMDRGAIAELSQVSAPDTQEVTETGTRDAAIGLNMLLPFAIMFLLFMGVMTGGQYLLTTTVEEKGSRVVEVLLSAVSPMQLMFGKILGQMFVGLSLLLVYNSLGIVALIVFNQLDLISAGTIGWMLVFFLLAYVMFASFMAAIGAAVNELREAQSLMSPVIMTLIVGFYLCFPVSQDPDAGYAVALSFIPPVSPLVMLTRVASTSPPPVWQPALAVVINAVAAYASVWFAAKVFRVGLLMFGKPPTLGTLIKWVRMA